MAKKDVENLIRRAITDEKFKNALAKDLKKTVASEGLNVTAEELKALGNVDWTQQLPTDKDPTEIATWVHIYKSNPQM